MKQTNKKRLIKKRTHKKYPSIMNMKKGGTPEDLETFLKDIQYPLYKFIQINKYEKIRRVLDLLYELKKENNAEISNTIKQSFINLMGEITPHKRNIELDQTLEKFRNKILDFLNIYPDENDQTNIKKFIHDMKHKFK